MPNRIDASPERRMGRMNSKFWALVLTLAATAACAHHDKPAQAPAAAGDSADKAGGDAKDMAGDSADKAGDKADDAAGDKK
jgi:hypothetical protein